MQSLSRCLPSVNFHHLCLYWPYNSSTLPQSKNTSFALCAMLVRAVAGRASLSPATTSRRQCITVKATCSQLSRHSRMRSSSRNVASLRYSVPTSPSHGTSQFRPPHLLGSCLEQVGWVLRQEGSLYGCIRERMLPESLNSAKKPREVTK